MNTGNATRQLLKGAAERLAHRSGLTTLGRRRQRGKVLVLAYHNVVPDGVPPEGDRSLHLPLSRFRAQMLELATTHDVIRLEEARLVDRGARPRAVITFDDAYRGALRLGLPELVRLGLPATLFVAPGRLGAASFWWDRYAPPGGWPAELYFMLLEDRAGREERVDEWARSAGCAAHPPSEWLQCASEAELAESARAPGIDVASHSWSHCNLEAVESDAELTAEIMRPLRWLEERGIPAVHWLAYPYGLRGARSKKAAHAAGIRGALRVEGGWWSPGRDGAHDIPRWNVPAGVSLGGFRMRLAGFWCR
jgi:peptidoglycan/xylan/chitin deacetylase (PgdA/CDA1 family)